MFEEMNGFVWLLAFIWFLVYWILGGVFFALMAVLRLGQVKKVRFSCLFTTLAALLGFGAAWTGMRVARDGQYACLDVAQNKAEVLTAIFGCGAVGVFGMFLAGAAILVLIGFGLLAISKSHHQPWIRFEKTDEQMEEEEKEEAQEASPSNGSLWK